MTMVTAEINERTPESLLADLRLLTQSDAAAIQLTLEDSSRPMLDRRILVAWFAEFLAAYQELYQRVSAYESVLRRRMAGRPLSEEDETKLNDMINESRSILQLQDDFDGNGSPRYSESTWERAIWFVRSQWEEYARVTDAPMPVPRISPGPHGSIDVLWETEEFDLLVNIPANPEQEAEYSGDSNGKRKFDGTLDPTLPNRGLVDWLAESVMGPSTQNP